MKYISNVEAAIVALSNVSFYSHINHGTKCKDYGEVADKALKLLGLPTGELVTDIAAIREAIKESEASE